MLKLETFNKCNLLSIYNYSMNSTEAMGIIIFT